MAFMEKQLASLTQLVTDLTHIQPRPINNMLDVDTKFLFQQMNDLKAKTNTLRHDLTSIRRMQQSLQVNFKMDLQQANKNIEVTCSSRSIFAAILALKEKLVRLNYQEKSPSVKNEFDTYIKNSSKIDRDLE